MSEGKKRLIFVITQPVVGGAQKYVFDLARYFNSQADYKVSVASGGPEDGDLFKKLAAEKISAHHLKSLNRDVSIVGDLLTVFDLVKLFRREQPDVVHLNSSKIGFLGCVAAFFYKLTTNNYKLKTIFTAHGWVFKEDLSRLTRLAAICVSWLSAKLQDRIICVSQNDFDLALKYKIAPPRKLYLVHNALAHSAELLPRHDVRAAISKMIGRVISNSAFMLVNLGRLYATKGLTYLIEAVRELKEKLPGEDIITVIFGDGPEREVLQRQATSDKRQVSISFVGDIPDAAKYLTAFDAMVISSVKEGFPYAILEAGAAGLPVVSTDVGGIGEVIESDKSGVLVEPKNSPALAEAMAAVLSDQTKSKKLSSELKRVVTQKFNFETMTEKTEWVYKI
ncbi:MAG: glycosyltransferase [Patescibacteria group bacterium]